MISCFQSSRIRGSNPRWLENVSCIFCLWRTLFLNVKFRTRLSQEYKPKMLKGVILQYFRVVFCGELMGWVIEIRFIRRCFMVKKEKKSFNEESEGNFVDLWSCKIWAKRRLRLDSGLTYNYENETWEITLPTRFYCKIWSSDVESFMFRSLKKMELFSPKINFYPSVRELMFT